MNNENERSGGGVAPVLNVDKRRFFLKTLLSTLLGGFKFSDEQAGRELGWAGYFLQLVFYAGFPIIPIAIGASDTDKSLGYVAGIIVGVLNLALQLIMVYLKRFPDGELVRQLNQIILVKPFWEIVFVTALSFGYGWLLEMQISSTNNVEESKVFAALSALNGIFSFYSLVAESPHETGKIVGENTHLGFYSTQFMRPLYGLIYLAVKFLFIPESSYSTYNVFFVIMPLLWLFGMLGPVFVSLMYFLERVNLWGLGRQPSASDIRTILQFTVDFGGCLIIAAIVGGENASLQDTDLFVKIVYLTGAWAIFMSSSNFLFELGLSNKKLTLSTKRLDLPILAEKCLLFIGLIIGVETASESSEDEEETNSYPVFIISFVLLAVYKFYTQTQSAYYLGLLRSFDRQFNITLNKIFQVLLLAYQIFATSFVARQELQKYFLKYYYPDLTVSYRDFIIPCCLMFRALRYSLSDFQDSAIIHLEYYCLDFQSWRFLVLAPFYQIVNRSIANAVRRLNVWLYAVLTMCRDKKQRISSTNLFVLAGFTLLLPMNVVSLVVSSVLDTSFLPFLGLPIFVFGFPRQKRIWPVCQNVITTQGESLLYKKFTENLAVRIQPYIVTNPSQFRTGRIFLVRIEKYLATFQILENSHGYTIFTLRGLESQEMTSCHNHEANTIDGIVERVFEKKELKVYTEFMNSIQPLKQFEVPGYEENQIKLTGIVEQEEFCEGFRQAYLKLLVYYCDRLLAKSDEAQIIRAAQIGLEYIKQGQVDQKYPTKFTELINLDLGRSTSLQEVVHNKGYGKQKQAQKAANTNTNQVLADTFMANRQSQGQKQKQENVALRVDWEGLELQQDTKKEEQKKLNPTPFTEKPLASNVNQTKLRNVFDEEEEVGASKKPVGKNVVASKVRNVFEDEGEAPQIVPKKIAPKIQDQNNNDLDDLLKDLDGEKPPQQNWQNQNRGGGVNNFKDQSSKKEQLFGLRLNQKSSGNQALGDENADIFEINLDQGHKNNQLQQSVIDNSSSEFRPKQERVQSLRDSQVQQAGTTTTAHQRGSSQSNYVQQVRIQSGNTVTSVETQKKKNLEDELEDILEDLENLPPPIPPQHEQYYQSVRRLVVFLYAVSASDLQLDSKNLDKKAVMDSFRDCGGLRKTNIFNSEDITNETRAKIMEIQLLAIRQAFKIALDWYSIYSSFEDFGEQEVLDEIQDNQKNSYIGLGSEPQWSQSIDCGIENLWSLHFNQHERTLAVFRSKFKNIKCTLFELNEDIVSGIWANLQFELFYVTNDDDERYSIQTHKQFLRNIIIESSENPLGYAPFYSGPLLIYQ